MKTKYITQLIAAIAALLSVPSCTVSVTPLKGGRPCGPTQMRRGPITVNDWGIPVGNQQCGNPQYGGTVPYGTSQYGSVPYGSSQYGYSGNQVQDNGSLRWDHHSSVVRVPISGNSRNQSPYGTSQYGTPTNYGQPMGSSGGQFQPSGRTVVCPGCGQRIGNAPSGTFPCQKCGATVQN